MSENSIHQSLTRTTQDATRKLADLPPGARETLRALARHVRAREGCVASHTELMRATGYGRRRVRRHIDQLEACGALRRRHRQAPSGCAATNAYQLDALAAFAALDELDAAAQPGNARELSPGTRERAAGLDRERSAARTSERRPQLDRETPATRSPTASTAGLDELDDVRRRDRRERVPS